MRAMRHAIYGMDTREQRSDDRMIPSLLRRKTNALERGHDKDVSEA
jgi:hypothetical protein